MKESISLGDAIRKFIEKKGLQTQYDEYIIKDLWTEVVGKTIADRTESVKWQRRKVYVKIKAGPAREYFSMIQEEVLQKLKEASGLHIEKIVLQ